jgi:hypothetical protein
LLIASHGRGREVDQVDQGQMGTWSYIPPQAFVQKYQGLTHPLGLVRLVGDI